MSHYEKPRAERLLRPRHRPNPAEWMLEPYARGEALKTWEVEARTMAFRAISYAGYEQMRCAIDRHEARGAELSLKSK